MKLFKKAMTVALAAVMTLGAATSVFAAGSKTNGVTAVDSAFYTVSAYSEAALKAEVTDTTTADAILEFAKDATKGASVDAFLEKIQQSADPQVKASAEQAAAEIKGLKFVVPFFDLDKVNEPEKTADGKYRVKLSVPSLTAEMADSVVLLHFSTARNVWEVIKPVSVDVNSKVIVADFADLSPVAVLAKTSTAAAAQTVKPAAKGAVNSSKTTTSAAKSPKTGVSANYMLYLVAAMMFAASAVVVARKKNA